MASRLAHHAFFFGSADRCDTKTMFATQYTAKKQGDDGKLSSDANENYTQIRQPKDNNFYTMQIGVKVFL